ncbi:MAG: hypothetical protein Q4G68_03765 [Planctomycetia bacterium]|nr:hypothetical protein [Planctomycetia bacterium]
MRERSTSEINKCWKPYLKAMNGFTLPDAPRLIKSIETKHFGDGSVVERGIVCDLKKERIPDTTFTLSHYGLPEPDFNRRRSGAQQ